jgi:hypothetical protein
MRVGRAARRIMATGNGLLMAENSRLMADS